MLPITRPQTLEIRGCYIEFRRVNKAICELGVCALCCTQPVHHIKSNKEYINGGSSIERTSSEHVLPII